MFLLFIGYRLFLLPITKAPTVGATDVNNLFDQNHFLRSRDRNFHKFYSMLMKTQMFTKFIEERSFVSETNTCLAFFDECVDRFEHEDGPKFLELEGFDSDRTVFILPPEAEKPVEGQEPKTYRTEKFRLHPELFPEREDSEFDTDTVADSSSDQTPKAALLCTPASSLAKRTKQEIRSAQKQAKSNQRIPYLWAKCLVNTCYSLWFLHLPGYMLAYEGKPRTLRIGLAQIQRMHRLRLHPADEICYRVMMQLCGLYKQPVLAVKVLFEMKNIGLRPNAVTYGYYNKAVLESEWPSGEESVCEAHWNLLRNVLKAMSCFKESGKQRRLRLSRVRSGSQASLKSETNSQSSANKELRDDPQKFTGPDNQNKSIPETENIDGKAAIEKTSTNPDETPEGKKPEESSETDETVTKSRKEEDGERDTESEEVVENENTQKRRQQFRKRMTSIVKTSGGLAEEGDTNVSVSADNLLEEEFIPKAVESSDPDVKRRLSFTSPEVKEKGDDKAGGPKNVAKYSDIRGRFSNLFNSKSVDHPDTGETSRTLFQSEEALTYPRGASEASEDNSLQSQSIESLDSQTTKQEEDRFLSPNHKLHKTASSSSIRSSQMVGTPVTENDPLGALSNANSPVQTMAKSMTLPPGDLSASTSNIKVDDNILGK